MGSASGYRKHASSEWPTTVLITVGLTLASTLLLLVCTSPEFSWDEASRLPYISDSWASIWNRYSVTHGPMCVYLAKLGQEILPDSVASIEVRSRFLITFVSSIGIGFLYWALRYSFETSRLAAIVGCCLLMLSFIRLEETDIIEAHQLMLACTLAVAGLGYQWRESPTLRAAIWLGGVMGLGALAMTYVIPAALCLTIAVSLAGKNWFAWDRAQLKIAWAFPIAVATSIIVVVALWGPSGVVHFFFDFLNYLRLKGFPTLVGDQNLASAPRWAALYWLINLELPLLITSILIIPAAMWKAFKRDQFSSRHTYLLVFLTFFLVTALTAHLAGARNLLQFIGLLCLVIGALFDEALGYNKQLVRFCSALVCLAAALNLLWLSAGSRYIPFLATDGYRVFVKQNEDRLREKTEALVFGLPILQYYAEQNGIPVGWSSPSPLSFFRTFDPSDDAPLDPEVKYVLIPEWVWRFNPPEQTMRRVVAEHWRMVWEFRSDHVWALRLYEKP